MKRVAETVSGGEEAGAPESSCRRHRPGQRAAHGLAPAAVHAVRLPDAAIHFDQQLLQQKNTQRPFKDRRVTEMLHGFDMYTTNQKFGHF